MRGGSLPICRTLISSYVMDMNFLDASNICSGIYDLVCISCSNKFQQICLHNLTFNAELPPKFQQTNKQLCKFCPYCTYSTWVNISLIRKKSAVLLVFICCSFTPFTVCLSPLSTCCQLCLEHSVSCPVLICLDCII